MTEIDALIEDYTKAIKAKLPNSLAAMIHTNSQPNKATVTVPYWFSITEHGRGIRKSINNYNLEQKIYKWMQDRNMFKSQTAKGRINEARGLTWYINKYGTKQFRNKEFRDVYTSETQKLALEVNRLALTQVKKISSDLVKL